MQLTAVRPPRGVIRRLVWRWAFWVAAVEMPSFLVQNQSLVVKIQSVWYKTHHIYSEIHHFGMNPSRVYDKHTWVAAVNYLNAARLLQRGDHRV